jgi:hypothetical protein
MGEDKLIQCEHCEKVMPGHDDAHSMIVVLQKCSMAGYSWYQCEEGGYVDGHNFQHWHCSKSAMRAGVSTCINSHYLESSLVDVPASQVRFHRQVLSAGLICKVCQASIRDTAYRFCLTVSTPANFIPDDSQNALGEWCCSLEHARENALTIISSIQ